MKTIVFTLSTLAILIGTKMDKNISNTMARYFSSASLENTTMLQSSNKDGKDVPIVAILSLDVFGLVEEGHKVETILVDGERIPVVTLPELEVVAK